MLTNADDSLFNVRTFLVFLHFKTYADEISISIDNFNFINNFIFNKCKLNQSGNKCR